MSRYDELKAAAKAATPGPWVAYSRAGEGAPDDGFLGWDFEDGKGPPEPGRGVLMGPDMRFVVLARRDVPALLSERERLFWALQMTTEALKRAIERRPRPDHIVNFTGEFARLGMPTVSEILDEANAALTARKPGGV